MSRAEDVCFPHTVMPSIPDIIHRLLLLRLLLLSLLHLLLLRLLLLLLSRPRSSWLCLFHYLSIVNGRVLCCCECGITVARFYPFSSVEIGVPVGRFRLVWRGSEMW